MLAKLRCDIVHFCCGQISWVRYNKIISPFHLFKPIGLDNISAGLHLMPHRISTGLQASQFRKIHANAICIGTFSKQSYQNTSRAHAQIKNPIKGDMKTFFLTSTQEKDSKYFKDAETGTDLEVVAADNLAEWLCNHYLDFGANIEFITDKSQEGYQFVKGFGGIGGFLRYQIEVDDEMDIKDGGGDDFDAEEDFI